MTIIEGFFSKRTVSGALARLSSMLLVCQAVGRQAQFVLHASNKDVYCRNLKNNNQTH